RFSFGTLIPRRTCSMTLTSQRRNHLYTLRRIRGLRQKQLAILLGYRGTTMISRFETGAALPALHVAILLELALGARMPEVYVDLYRELQTFIIKRAARLPKHLARQIRGRLLGKD